MEIFLLIHKITSNEFKEIKKKSVTNAILKVNKKNSEVGGEKNAAKSFFEAE